MRTCVLMLISYASFVAATAVIAEEQDATDLVAKNMNSAKDDVAPIQTLVGPIENWNGRVVQWDPGVTQLAAEQAETLAVRENSGTLSLSFSHAGYTAEDPDGKQAVLTVTVLKKAQPLTADEKEKLTTAGYTLSDRLSILPIGEWKLNLHLPAEANEEDRLRREQQLPRTIDAGIQPISLRWKDVPGKDLYRWLTHEDNGLALAISPFTDANHEILVEATFTRQSSADDTQLSKWWESHAGGNPSFRWRGGVGPLAVSIIEFGCIKTPDNGTLRLSDAFFEAEQLSERLKQVIVIDATTRVSSITRERFDRLDWTFTGEYRVRASTAVGPELRIGTLLLDHPELVRDLSGEGRGLEAILQDDKK